MAKQIIVLSDRIEKPGIRVVQLCLWIAVPAGQELPNPNRTSAYLGASAAENTALTEGTVIEEVYHLHVPATYNKAALIQFAEDFYGARNSAYTSTMAAIGYPGKNYGDHFDGTDWTDV